MTRHAGPALVARAALSPQEMSELQALALLCNEQEGLDMKLSYPIGLNEEPGAFLCYAGGLLVGYCGLDGDEVCGAVHPHHRRRGIGRALLAAALGEARRRNKPHLLLICEHVSLSGQAFVAALGGAYAFGEHRMALGRLPGSLGVDARLRLERAGPQDVDRLTEILAASFGDPEAIARDNVVRSLAQPSDQFYLAWRDDTPVGTLKLFYEPPRVGIYAFGVLPAYQGQGIGRQMLFQACKQLWSEGYRSITLEVETDNERALRVYRACGFQETTTYGYYWVANQA